MDVARKNCLLLDMRNSKTHIRSSQTWSRLQFPKAACFIFLRFVYKSLSGLWIEIYGKKNPTISWSVCVPFRHRSWGISRNPPLCVIVCYACVCIHIHVFVGIHVFMHMETQWGHCKHSSVAFHCIYWGWISQVKPGFTDSVSLFAR